MGSTKGDNVGKISAGQEGEQKGKGAAESAVNAWKEGASSPADTKIAAQPKNEEHGFLNFSDLWNQGLHKAQDMIENFGKPSPEQVAAEQAKAAREQADKAADSTANNIYDRLHNKQLSYDSTVSDINKELNAMDWATRQNVLEHLKKKEGFGSPIHVDKKDGDYVVTWGGGFGASGEHVYP